MGAAELPERPERLADEHWATICRLSQLHLHSPRARHARHIRRWLGIILVRAGLRLAEPLTVESLLGRSRARC